MYQSAASEAVRVQIQECLGVPLVVYTRQGQSIETGLTYQTTESDEVEDLAAGIRQAQTVHAFDAVCCGALLSTYQRVRVEHVCDRLQLTSMAPLWRRAPQAELLTQMLEDGVHAVIVRAAAPPGLTPRHLGQSLQQLQSRLLQCNQQYGLHVCGEGGEYETLVLDCALFGKRLVLDETEIDDAGDGTGNLRILQCHGEPKEQVAMSLGNEEPKSSPAVTSKEPPVYQPPTVRLIPHVRRLYGGLMHVYALSGRIRGTAVQQALDILDQLQSVLDYYQCTRQDVLLVHVYLSNMALFGEINQYYKEFFGTHLPPSRSCVATTQPAQDVVLDCLIQRHTAKQVLHVQSRSTWAPVCVGPYSQCNTVRNVVHFVAGQIGLDPWSMTFLTLRWKEQLVQTYRNLARVLDALEGKLHDVQSCLIYVSEKVEWSLEELLNVSQEAWNTNGGVVAGAIDSAKTSIDEYEDEETRLAVEGETVVPPMVPILVVEIPEMPVGALVEVEAIAATSALTSCLDAVDQHHSEICKLSTEEIPCPLGWDIGHAEPLPTVESTVRIHVACRSIPGCLSAPIVAASWVNDNNPADMMALWKLLWMRLQAQPYLEHVVVVRVYYLSSLGDWRLPQDSPAALTLVPVSKICLLPDKEDCILALHAFCLNAPQAETEIWIRKR